MLPLSQIISNDTTETLVAGVYATKPDEFDGVGPTHVALSPDVFSHIFETLKMLFY